MLNKLSVMFLYPYIRLNRMNGICVAYCKIRWFKICSNEQKYFIKSQKADYPCDPDYSSSSILNAKDGFLTFEIRMISKEIILNKA